MILIFVPNISNPFYASIVSGIEDTMKKDGYGTMLCITNGDKSREEDFIKLLYDGQADGAVILCIDKNDRNIGKPVSYTHLDVYKRQPFRRAAAPGCLPSCPSAILSAGTK